MYVGKTPSLSLSFVTPSPVRDERRRLDAPGSRLMLSRRDIAEAVMKGRFLKNPLALTRLPP